MFHVPEQYRRIDGQWARMGRVPNNGAFALPPLIPQRFLFCFASDGGYSAETCWEHVSVHVSDAKGRLKTPCWDEMCSVKDLCWDAEDIVMQLHPARSQWVNQHAHTLHLWRPVGIIIPTPPPEFVGLQTTPSSRRH